MIRVGTDRDFIFARELSKTMGFTHWAGNALDLWAKRKGSVFVVAEEEGQIVGFALSRSILDEGEILVLCIKEDYRKCGLATQLIEKTFLLLKEIGVKTVFLEVNENNAPALRLYKKMGFEKITVRKKYYDNRDDGFLMRRMI